MGADSKIQWTHHTFNPWEGCVKVSAGCKNCYAEARNARFHARHEGARKDYQQHENRVDLGFAGRGMHWGADAPRLMRSESYWNEPLRWNRMAREAGARRRVFCASLADVFEDRVDLDAPRARLWELIDQCGSLDWLLLTKRPENVLACVPEAWLDAWPAHVWMGTTCEDQEQLAVRAQHLYQVPAKTRFLSCEPLLESLPHLDEYLHWVSWVIVGGESGKGARPFHLNWARNIVHDCAENGVPCFVKQLGEQPRDWRFESEDYSDYAAAALSDEHSMRVHFAGKGGDPNEWEPYLRVRQVPGYADVDGPVVP